MSNVEVVPEGTEIEIAHGVVIEATEGVAIIDMESGKTTTGSKQAGPGKPQEFRTKLTDAEKKFLRLMMIRATSPFPVGQPYLTPMFFRLIPTAATGLKTMAVTEDWHLLIDFEFAMEKGLEWAAGVLGHEPWHLLRGDFERYRKLDAGTKYQKNHQVWNIAMDMEINDDIVDIIPDDGSTPGNGALADYEPYKTGEEYYHQLIEDRNLTQEQQGNGNGQGQQGSGEGQPGQGQPGSGKGSGSAQGQGQQGSGNGSGQPGDGQGQGAGNGKLELTDALDDSTVCGGGQQNVENAAKQLRDSGAEGVDPVEAAATTREIATRIKNSKRSIGNDRGAKAAVQWAEDYLAEEPVNWRKELRATLSNQVSSAKRGRMDYSYRKPSHRQQVRNIIFPGMVEPQLKLVMGIDTSGSNMHNMGLIVEETVRIAQQMSIRGDNFQAFAVDVDVDKMTPVNNPKDVLKGRRMNGGTRMRPAYEFVAKLRGEKKPGVFLLVTDGEVFGDDLPDSPPKGISGTAVITALTLTGKPHDEHNQQTIAATKARLSSWSKVIVLYNVGADE